MIPSGPDEAVTIVRDFTEQRRAEADSAGSPPSRRRCGAWRRWSPATPPPGEVFQSVTEEVCRLLGLRTAVLARFEEPVDGDDRRQVRRACPGGTSSATRSRSSEGAALEVLRTGAPTRVDYAELASETLHEFRALGYRGEVGVPITVAGATWGALVVVLHEDETIPPATEHRLRAFAELVAWPSRAPRRATSWPRRAPHRRGERRRAAPARAQPPRRRPAAARRALARAAAGAGEAPRRRPTRRSGCSRQLADELAQALDELRELAQGIHPAVLTERGLGRRSRCSPPRRRCRSSSTSSCRERLPEPVEAAAYYVVSEALANVAKYARRRRGERARRARRRPRGRRGRGRRRRRRRPERGPGLRGLRDRVEALGGQSGGRELARARHTRPRRAAGAGSGNLAAFARER